MARTTLTHRPSAAARRLGYVIAVLVNGAILYAVNAWPGWQAVPFLTNDTRQVLGLVNLSLVAGVVANVVYLIDDAPWLVPLGGVVTTGIGLAVLVRLQQVFPFAFRGSFNWPPVVHFVLVVGIVCTALGMIVQFVSLLRQLIRGGAHAGPSSTTG